MINHLEISFNAHFSAQLHSYEGVKQQYHLIRGNVQDTNIGFKGDRTDSQIFNDITLNEGKTKKFIVIFLFLFLKTRDHSYPHFH